MHKTGFMQKKLRTHVEMNVCKRYWKSKRTRHIIESACISHFKTITQRPGNINLDKNISYRILKEHSLLPEIKALNSRFITDPT